jgi:hypothetical protein
MNERKKPGPKPKYTLDEMRAHVRDVEELAKAEGMNKARARRRLGFSASHLEYCTRKIREANAEGGNAQPSA